MYEKISDDTKSFFNRETAKHRNYRNRKEYFCESTNSYPRQYTTIHQEFPFYFLARDILFNRHIYFHNDSFRSDKNPMKFGLVLFFVSALSAYHIENSHKNS